MSWPFHKDSMLFSVPEKAEELASLVKEIYSNFGNKSVKDTDVSNISQSGKENLMA